METVDVGVWFDFGILLVFLLQILTARKLLLLHRLTARRLRRIEARLKRLEHLNP